MSDLAVGVKNILYLIFNLQNYKSLRRLLKTFSAGSPIPFFA